MRKYTSFGPKEPVVLEPPKNQPFTLKQLSEYDGNQKKQVYVSINGTIFDVTPKRELYGDGGRYHMFAAKDASRPLGKMSFDEADTASSISWDCSDLTEKQISTKDDWYTYFSKRYNIVGKVTDIPKK